MTARILRLVRGVRRVCDAVEELLDRDLRAETPADAEIVRRVAAEARADRLERELRLARRLAQQKLDHLSEKLTGWTEAALAQEALASARGHTIWRLQNRLARLRRHLRRAQATARERADELRRAQEELARVAESVDARDELRRMTGGPLVRRDRG